MPKKPTEEKSIQEDSCLSTSDFTENDPPFLSPEESNTHLQYGQYAFAKPTQEQGPGQRRKLSEIEPILPGPIQEDKNNIAPTTPAQEQGTTEETTSSKLEEKLEKEQQYHEETAKQKANYITERNELTKQLKDTQKESEKKMPGLQREKADLQREVADLQRERGNLKADIENLEEYNKHLKKRNDTLTNESSESKTKYDNYIEKEIKHRE